MTHDDPQLIMILYSFMGLFYFSLSFVIIIILLIEMIY
jgi:hypothetical protein